MNQKVKQGSALWLIVSIVLLLLVAGLLFLMLQEKDKRIKTEQKLSEVELAKKAVETDLNQTQSELAQLKEKAKVLAEDLANAKKKQEETLAELDKKNNQIGELQESLVSKEKEKTGLAETLVQLGENYSKLEAELAQARQQAKQLADAIDELKGKPGVELKKIVVKPKKKLSGKVLVVNKEFQFVVINLGKKDSLNVGDQLGVYHGREEIAKIQVEKVYDEMATANILAGSQLLEINEDDVVKSL